MIKLLSYVTLMSIILSGGAVADEVNGKWGTMDLYGFAEVGMATSDINLNSSSVTSGSYTYTETVDKTGTMTKLGIGMSLAESMAVEAYVGRLTGFSNTATLTATNAVIGGYTLNGSLTGVEAVEADLQGVSLIFSGGTRFANDNKISYFGRVGFVNIDLVDTVTFSGTGTVDGTAVSTTAAVTTFKESGTTPTLGAGISYATQANLLFSAAVDYIPNVGGTYVAKSNITSVTLSMSVKF